MCNTIIEGIPFVSSLNHEVKNLQNDCCTVLSVISELISFAKIHGGTDISCLYRLIIFDIVLQSLQDLFSRTSTQADYFEVFQGLLWVYWTAGSWRICG